MFKSSIIALAAATSYAAAGCTGTVGLLAFGDLGSCLQLTSLLPVIQNGGDLVSSVNSYLGSLCASSTPQCSNSTLTNAESNIQSGCSSDLSGGGTNAAEVNALLTLLKNYPQVIAAGCSKNTTTNDYCLTETLTTIQQSTGSNITVSYIAGLLGSSDSISSLEQVFGTGKLCTSCVSGIYYEVKQANSSVADSSVGKALTNQCGADFGASAPGSTVSQSASQSSSPAATSGAGSAGFPTASPFAGLTTVLAVGGSIVGAAVLGAVTVF
ncbi:hypothetical protein IAU60_004098 [Kwoniella sp. DSM 27419]